MNLDDLWIRQARIWSSGMLTLIMLSCTAFVTESMPSLCCGRYDAVSSSAPQFITASGRCCRRGLWGQNTAPVSESSDWDDLDWAPQAHPVREQACGARPSLPAGIRPWADWVRSIIERRRHGPARRPRSGRPPARRPRRRQVWSTIETVCVSAFTAEYLGRLAVVPPWAYTAGASPAADSEPPGIVTRLLGREVSPPPPPPSPRPHTHPQAPPTSLGGGESAGRVVLGPRPAGRGPPAESSAEIARNPSPRGPRRAVYAPAPCLQTRD